jgi:hypothetical protein
MAGSIARIIWLRINAQSCPGERFCQISGQLVGKGISR